MSDVARDIPNEEHIPPPPEPAAVTRFERPRRTGPVAPHDLEAEESLLGAMLLSRDAVDRVTSEGLDVADFYRPAHGYIYAAITAVHAAGKPVDPVTVSDELRANGFLDMVGGPTALVTISAHTPSTSSAAAYARIVIESAARRRLMAAAGQIIDAALDLSTDLVDVVHRANTLITGAAASTASDVEFEDVAAAVRGDIEDLAPTILRRHDGTALIYPGLTHWLMGEPGKGKTWVALYAVAEQLHDGNDVLYLDWEGNRRIIGARLRNLGVTPELVETHLRYLRPPLLTRTVVAGLVHVAETCSLAVYDGVAKAIARQGLNEDKAPDVLAWLELLVNPISDAGAAGLLLDHVTKEKEGRGLWARGSGAKLGEVSGAAWLVKPKEGFSRQKGGRIDLVQAKDREGYTAADGATVANIGFMPDPDTGHLEITVRTPADAAKDGTTTFRPTGIMEKVSRCIENFQSSLDIEPGVNQIDNDLPGVRREWMSAAIACLVDEGFVVRRKGSGKRVHHAVVRPYRELDDPLSDRYTAPENQPEEAPWDDL